MTSDPWGDRHLSLASTGMGKKIAVVALFAVLGLGVGAGISAARPNPRAWEFTLQIGLPNHSRGTIVHLAALARSQHVHRVRVLVDSKREFRIVGYGSSVSGASKAVDTATNALPRPLYPPFLRAIGAGRNGQVYSRWPPVIGLALGLAIGILVAVARSRRAPPGSEDLAAVTHF
jgi:hypothetical protein